MNPNYTAALILSVIISIVIIDPQVANCNNEIVVREGESIQEAINTAPPRAIIKIMPGKFREKIEINKTLTIIGSGGETIIQGSDTPTCITILRGVTNVVLANLSIDGTGSYKSTGLWIQQSHRNQVLNVTIKNFHKGLRIYDSIQNVLRNVHLMNNTYNLEVYGLYLSHFIQDIDLSNTVNGKKIYYVVNAHDITLTVDAGYVAVINSTNINITNLTLSDNFSGLLLAYTNNTMVSNINCTWNVQGIRLVNCHNVTITNSSLTFNEWSGISLEPATACKIYLNTFKFNQYALYLSFSPYILQVKTRDNKIFLNEIANNSVGIYIDRGGLANKIFNNNLVGNDVAVTIDEASNNFFFHNNFLENAKNVEFFGASFSNLTNFWDGGYPYGGNFWSNYYGTDNYSGPSQDAEGIDGIVDKPYSIGFNNIDMYPLSAPITSIYTSFDHEYPFEIMGFLKILEFNFNPVLSPCVTFKAVTDIADLRAIRIGIPKILLWAENDEWTVLLNGSQVKFEIFSSNNYTFLCFKIDISNNYFDVIEIKILGTGAVSEHTSINLIIGMLFITLLILFASAKKSRKMPIKILYFIVFFILLLPKPLEVLTYDYSVGGTLIVGDGGFNTINEALEHASSGDKIIVKAGVYREQIVINKMLRLYGEGLEKTIIETNATMDAVVIVTSNVSVQGFTIRNFGGTAYSSGVRLINASSCSIEKNLIEGKFVGIRLENGSCRNIVKNNLIKNCHYGMFFIRRSSENIVFNNTILDSSWNGIELAWHSNNNVFEANSIVNSGGFGIEIPIYTPSFGNVIFHNNFLNNSLSHPLERHASDFFNNSWFFNGEGNFWDNHKIVDLDKNGIGDIEYCINQERGIYDKFPLMGKFHCFGFFDQTVSVISSSEILFVNINFSNGFAYINISLYEEGEYGFMRVDAPKELLSTPFNLSSNKTILIKYWSTSSGSYFYIEYFGGNNFIQMCGVTEIPEMNLSLLCIYLIAFYIVMFFIRNRNKLKA